MIRLSPSIPRLLALCCTLVLIILSAGALPAQARGIDPDMVTSIEVHKFEQPEQLGTTANGLPQDTSGLVAVAGATFTATRIPDVDLTTNSGQQKAASLSIEAAATRVAGETVAARATTDASGRASLSPLGVGLYFIREEVVPAGFAGAAPFLVALPLTNPADSSSWLNTVHVYPKNSRANISIAVTDADAVTIGDSVHWRSSASIPVIANLDGYRIFHRIPNTLILQERSVQIGFNCAGCPALVEGRDYTLTINGGEITVDFLEPGLRLLNEHSSAQVIVEYDTTVTTTGVHQVETHLYPDRAAIEADRRVSDTAETRWGAISVSVYERENPSNLIPGASFRLYLTKEDALARRNPVTVEGVAHWTTDAQGNLVIDGLRFSDYVNGLDRDSGDPLYREYWVAPINTPSGWEWVDTTPLGASVNSTVEVKNLKFRVTKNDGIIITPPPAFPDDVTPPDSDQGDSSAESGTPGRDNIIKDITDAGTGRGSLAVTGAQVTGLFILGAVFVAIGGLFLMAHRRRKTEN